MIKVNDTNIPVMFKLNRQVLTEKQNNEIGNTVSIFSANSFYLQSFRTFCIVIFPPEHSVHQYRQEEVRPRYGR